MTIIDARRAVDHLLAVGRLESDTERSIRRLSKREYNRLARLLADDCSSEVGILAYLEDANRRGRSLV